MRWLLVSCLGVLAACAPAEPVDQGVVRQALGFPAIPELSGSSQGSHLGASLAPCPGSGYIAGAPGNGGAVFVRSASVVISDNLGNSLGLAVACDGVANSPRMLAAAGNGVSFLGDAGWHGFTNTSAYALAGPVSAPAGQFPLLVGQPNKTVRFIDPVTLSDASPPLDGGLSTFGSALAWFPAGGRFIVGTPNSKQVQLYDYLPDAGVVQGLLIPSTTANFGRAVAIGEVSPRPGPELIIGSEGVVYVYQQDGTLLWRVTGTDPSFGISLAVERGAMNGLDAFWVGEPGLDQVHRFVGTLGVVTSSPDPMSVMAFGTSMSIDGTRKLSVGAPYFGGTSQHGAVFSQLLSTSVLFGAAVECSGTSCVTPSCEVGTCVGGVFCETSSIPLSVCLSGDTCNGMGLCVMGDGGIRNPPDAGADAGTPIDAGSTPVDAGSTPADAGTPDAGSTPVDAGSTPVDAGSTPVDAGSTPVDAGSTPDDAGSTPVDAGLDGGDAGSDAGSPRDAGSTDGGTEPGGQLTFATCGCSGGAALPMALLGLALLRRRR